jgi:hypothetical protein
MRTVLCLLIGVISSSCLATQTAKAGSFALDITFGGGGSTGVTSYVVENTSDGSSPDLIGFSIANFYSSSAPIFASLPTGWSGTALSTSVFFYTVVFSADGPTDYIQPGAILGGFTVDCTKPADAPAFRLVNVPATGYFDDDSQQIHPYAGAMRSVIPEPSTLILCGLSLTGLLAACRRKS